MRMRSTALTVAILLIGAQARAACPHLSPEFQKVREDGATTVYRSPDSKYVVSIRCDSSSGSREEVRKSLEPAIEAEKLGSDLLFYEVKTSEVLSHVILVFENGLNQFSWVGKPGTLPSRGEELLQVRAAIRR